MSRTFTIGYGGIDSKEELLEILKSNRITLVVDIRLTPQRASMGIFVRAKDPSKGIESWLSENGIKYQSLVELGNPFNDGFPDDWEGRYSALLESSGHLLLERFLALDFEKETVCLLCAEKRHEECHRSHLADYLARLHGFEVTHIIR